MSQQNKWRQPQAQKENKCKMGACLGGTLRIQRLMLLSVFPVEFIFPAEACFSGTNNPVLVGFMQGCYEDK